MKGIVSYICKRGLPPGDSGVPLMGFKQGSDMARFMVQKEHSGARLEQRTIQWKTWGPLGRRQLLYLGRKLVVPWVGAVGLGIERGHLLFFRFCYVLDQHSCKMQ